MSHKGFYYLSRVLAIIIFVSPFLWAIVELFGFYDNSFLMSVPAIGSIFLPFILLGAWLNPNSLVGLITVSIFAIIFLIIYFIRADQYKNKTFLTLAVVGWCLSILAAIGFMRFSWDSEQSLMYLKAQASGNSLGMICDGEYVGIQIPILNIEHGIELSCFG